MYVRFENLETRLAAGLVHLVRGYIISVKVGFFLYWLHVVLYGVRNLIWLGWSRGDGSLWVSDYLATSFVTLWNL